MTCAAFRAQLDAGPPVLAAPDWAAAVRHTWDCAACRAELAATVALAERVRAALCALPGPPPLPAAVAAPPPEPSARERLARLGPALPAAFRLAIDPLALVPAWLLAAPSR